MRKFKNCLSVLEAFPAKTREYVVRKDVEYVVLPISIAPLKKTEFAVALDIRQGVVPLQ